MVFSRPGLCFLSSGVFACLSGLARFLVRGLYEVIHYILSLANSHKSLIPYSGSHPHSSLSLSRTMLCEMAAFRTPTCGLRGTPRVVGLLRSDPPRPLASDSSVTSNLLLSRWGSTPLGAVHQYFTSR